MNSLPTIPLFPSGRLVATPGALALLEQTNKLPVEFLSRHLRGDWGDLDEEDKTENEFEPEVWTPIAEQLSGQREREALGDHRSGSICDHVAFARGILMFLFCREIPSLSSSISVPISRRVP